MSHTEQLEVVKVPLEVRHLVTALAAQERLLVEVFFLKRFLQAVQSSAVLLLVRQSEAEMATQFPPDL